MIDDCPDFVGLQVKTPSSQLRSGEVHEVFRIAAVKTSIVQIILNGSGTPTDAQGSEREIEISDV